MPIEALERPASGGLRVRGRNIMALVLAPEFPIAAWFAALDRQRLGDPGFFAERPVVADLSAVADVAPEATGIVLEGLESRDLRLVGVEGVDPARLAGTPWRRLASVLHGRQVGLAARPTLQRSPAAPPAPSLLIDRPVRSGQSIVFEAGDVTVVGAVASGAEVIAGGSIHVYGPLRGRAIAGLSAGAAARIFCRALEAEMVGVDRLYRTAEHWGAELHGRPVQIRCDRGALKLSPIV
jgi:septum site-determining protein MinC